MDGRRPGAGGEINCSEASRWTRMSNDLGMFRLLESSRRCGLRPGLGRSATSAQRMYHLCKPNGRTPGGTALRRTTLTLVFFPC